MLLRRLFLCLRLLVASVAGSPAGGRVGVFLTLDLVVRCSSTSGAGIEFWCPGTLCGSPVPYTPWRLGNLSIFLVRGYGSSFPPPTSGRSFIGGTSAGSCPLLWLTAVSLAFGLVFAVISGSGGFPYGYSWSPGSPSLGCGGRLHLIYPCCFVHRPVLRSILAYLRLSFEGVFSGLVQVFSCLTLSVPVGVRSDFAPAVFSSLWFCLIVRI